MLSEIIGAPLVVNNNQKLLAKFHSGMLRGVCVGGGGGRGEEG